MPSNVQLKGVDAGDPWWVIEGTPGEIAQQIAQVFPHLAISDPTEFPLLVLKARAEWIKGGDSARTAAPAVPAAVTTTFPGATQVSSGPTAPAPQASAPQAQAAPGGAEHRIETDKWGNVFEFNHPKAPQTQYGTAVLRRAKSKAGAMYARWEDPRGKNIPGNWQKGLREDPQDKWDGGFADGV